MLNFPKVLLTEMMEYISMKDARAVRRTCQAWRELKSPHHNQEGETIPIASKRYKYLEWNAYLKVGDLAHFPRLESLETYKCPEDAPDTITHLEVTGGPIPPLPNLTSLNMDYSSRLDIPDLSLFPRLTHLQLSLALHVPIPPIPPTVRWLSLNGDLKDFVCPPVEELVLVNCRAKCVKNAKCVIVRGRPDTLFEHPNIRWQLYCSADMSRNFEAHCIPSKVVGTDVSEIAVHDKEDCSPLLLCKKLTEIWVDSSVTAKWLISQISLNWHPTIKYPKGRYKLSNLADECRKAIAANVDVEGNWKLHHEYIRQQNAVLDRLTASRTRRENYFNKRWKERSLQTLSRVKSLSQKRVKAVQAVRRASLVWKKRSPL